MKIEPNLKNKILQNSYIFFFGMNKQEANVFAFFRSDTQAY